VALTFERPFFHFFGVFQVQPADPLATGSPATTLRFPLAVNVKVTVPWASLTVKTTVRFFVSPLEQVLMAGTFHSTWSEARLTSGILEAG
jgi:hypothetical protein